MHVQTQYLVQLYNRTQNRKHIHHKDVVTHIEYLLKLNIYYQGPPSYYVAFRKNYMVHMGSFPPLVEVWNFGI
jgi:hypothetical protein